MVLAPFSDFTLSSLKLYRINLSFSHKHVLIFTNFHNITFFFFYSLTQLVKLFNNSIVLLSLEALIDSSCSSLSSCIFKKVKLLRVASLFFFCRCLLANQALGTLSYMSQFCIISLLQCIIQLFFQLFCMALQ